MQRAICREKCPYWSNNGHLFLTCVLHTSMKVTFSDIFENVGEIPHYLFSLQHERECKTKINPKSTEREGEEESCAVVIVRLCRHHRRKCPLFFSFSFPFQIFCFIVTFQIITELESRAPQNLFMNPYWNTKLK